MATYQPYTEYSSVTGGGFESTESRPTTTDSGSGNRSTTLTPVTIKQILNSTQEIQDGPFVSHGQELHHVSFVGVIRNITDHTSNIFVTIEDGTGQIEVRKWSDDANDMTTSQEDSEQTESSQIAQQYQIGTYVKVYGALKEFGGKKNIQYAVIKNIESFNDVLSHHLDAIKWHAVATGKVPDPSTTGDSQSVGGNGSATSGQSLFVTENSGSNNNGGDVRENVLNFIKEQCVGKDANQFAVPIQLIAQTLNIDEAIARQSCTTLTDQGTIYPTFDDNHYFAL
ncbi:similar to Saccharomyces cerevisiae YNL312W RFA2 Subunit of heterotrimeric Replication Protein A (RPA) [Maudiozyma saulgeensis]|uniref:Similar to Saccharomyces cerevisiae YNL312W RFA2 Subunit of heterotrimeric Replication Protein A (RPA) n=1 Tax=Maudiozyma saulgeensis TaxID=1789683 RepID=A0A1X7R9V1_9SACH|nr:similar to Saccharomyces cerevisiae YNL312W RFA2 Subunit of heterotrimeric Replication Protein A (RPA) [Kazachstania saulgeensis]